MKDLDLLAFNESDDMIVKFETNNGRVSGTQNLIQHIIKRIFTIQGSNTFNPEIGGQFNLLFKAITPEEAQEFEETFGILLEAVKEQVQRAQVEYADVLDASEKLLDLHVDSMTYDPMFGGFLITIRVVTANNVSTTVSIV